MKISRVILKGVNNFDDFSYSFEDEWTKTVPDSLLLMGPNGSGKTTLLKSIEWLWLVLQAFLTTPLNEFEGAHLHSDIMGWEGCRLAGMEIKELLPKPLWISVGKQSEVDKLLDNYRNSYRVSAIWSARIPEAILGSIKWQYKSPGELNAKPTNKSGLWVEELRERFVQNRLGATADLPNMVVLESEGRSLLEIEEEFSVTPEQEVFQWRALYTATARRQGSIQNYLFTLKAIDPKSYEHIVAEANKFLAHKEIIGFDKATGELLVKTESGQIHPMHLLSSGEKQILLMLAFITRWLRPGGVVLIDEPDLHLHVSLSNAFVSHLQQMVADQNGQLIIASHAPELWERFTEAQRVELGSLVEVQ